MEIIKPGNLDKKDGVITFTCPNCDCVFTAESGEDIEDILKLDGWRLNQNVLTKSEAEKNFGIKIVDD